MNSFLVLLSWGRGFLHDEVTTTTATNVANFGIVSFLVAVSPSCLWLATPTANRLLCSSSRLAISVNFLSDNLNAQMCENSTGHAGRNANMKSRKRVREKEGERGITTKIAQQAATSAAAAAVTIFMRRN